MMHMKNAMAVPFRRVTGPRHPMSRFTFWPRLLSGAGSLDPDLVVKALESTDRKGVMGRMRFHRGHQAIFGQNPEQDVLACVAQWKAPGRRIIVYPNAIAEGQITLPALMPSVPKALLK